MTELRPLASGSGDLLRIVLDSLDALIFVKDAEGRYLFVNRRCASAWGRPAEECIGKLDSDLFPPEIAARSAATDRQVLETQAPCQVDEDAVFAGEARVLLSLRAPLRAGDGAPAGVCGIATDITDRAAAEIVLRRRVAALEEMAERKDQFLAILSHELRNPLAPIRYAIEFLVLRHGDQIPQLDVIDRQTRHLTRLVDDLLDVTRINGGDFPVAPASVALRLIVDRAIELVRPSLDRRSQQLVSSCDDLISIHADEVRLVQALSNLLHNASVYSPEQATIWLSASPRDGQLAIEVRDTGIGIEPALLPRLFEPFQRGVGGQPGGLGLGLTIARHIVHAHGGTLTAHSDGPDLGSVFTATLPLLS